MVIIQKQEIIHRKGESMILEEPKVGGSSFKFKLSTFLGTFPVLDWLILLMSEEPNVGGKSSILTLIIGFMISVLFCLILLISEEPNVGGKSFKSSSSICLLSWILFFWKYLLKSSPQNVWIDYITKSNHMHLNFLSSIRINGKESYWRRL